MMSLIEQRWLKICATRWLPQNVTCHIILVKALLAQSVGAHRSGSNFSTCAAASQAIAADFGLSGEERQTLHFVGGHDSMDHPMGLLSFLVLGALSPTAMSTF